MPSDNSDFPPWTCETRIGITLIAEAATLSFLSVISLLVYILYQVFGHRKQPEAKLIRSHLDLYLLGLLFSDLIQAVGGMMDIRWVALSGVLEGKYCTVQGFLEQIGDVGVALCTLAISTHTFAEIALKWEEPKNSYLPKIMLPIFALFLLLITIIGYIIHRNNDYYGNTVYWCWITKQYLAEGIGLEYAWMWLAATLTFFHYFVAFLISKQYITVERTPNGRYYIYINSRKTRTSLRQYRSHVSPYRLLYFPAAYIITVIPVGIVRIHAFIVSTGTTPFPVTVLGGMLFSAGGFFNVMVYTFTRPGLLRYPRQAGFLSPIPERQHTTASQSTTNTITVVSRPGQVALPVRSIVEFDY